MHGRNKFMELIVRNVKKKLDRQTVLENVNLTLESGNIYAFVGRNGSGKTTLLKMIAGLSRVKSGEIIWNGKVLGKDIKTIPRLGMVLENAGLYPWLSAYDNLKLFADIKHIIGKAEIRESIKRVGLDPDDKKKFGKFSLGMKQRLMIAQAIMERPDLILLDEPSNALDLNGVDEIRKILDEEKQRGAMILLASHSAEDIRILADKVYLVENGTIREATY